MCGENAIQTIRTNWKKYALKLRDLNVSSTQDSGVDADLEALQILDRKVRTSGPSAHSPAAFSLHEVRNVHSH